MSWIEKWAGKNKAKINSFRQHFYPPENRFELNYVLEAADLRVAIQDSPGDRNSMYTSSVNPRRHRSLSFSLAKVVGKQGSRICLRHLGTDDRNDIWLMIDSDMIRPYPSGKELSVPFGYMNNHSVWNKTITKVDKEENLAPLIWFPPHPNDPGSNSFKVGEKIEAVDRRNAQLICPATIAKINGNFVLVSFDGWSGTFDYWASYNSQDLFPVGWCSKAKHKLQHLGPYYEVVGSTISKQNIEYSAPFQTQNSSKRIKGVTIDIKLKPSKAIKKSVQLSQKKATHARMDSDSFGTDFSVADDNSKHKKLKISHHDSPLTEQTKADVEFQSKSKAFRNLFRLWTEKTALETKKEILDEKEKIKNDIDKKQKDDENSSKELIDEERDKNMMLAARPMVSSVKISADIIDDVTPMSNQLASSNHKSPSIVNSSVANSIIEDYKCLSDTSGTSYCARIDEISSIIMSQSDITTRISSLANLPLDPYLWTIDDVQSYITNKNPTLELVAREFRTHEIDGQALLLLTMNTLRQYMKIKLGPAIKVEHIIKDLLEGKI